jgi:hypothetical protein
MFALRPAPKQKRTFETGLSSRVSTLNTADTLWTRWGRRFAERIDKNRDQPGIHQCGKQGERVTVTELKH